MSASMVNGGAKTALIVTALLATQLAFAGPSVSSHEMNTALAKAREGPTELRRYVERTKPIYALDYQQVMAVAESQKIASRPEPTVVAQVEKK